MPASQLPIGQSSIVRAYPAAPTAWSALPAIEHNPPALVQAIGSRVWSDDGAEYVDFDNQGGAVLLGHRDPTVIAAVRLARSSEERHGPARFTADIAALIADMAEGAEACAFGDQPIQALRAAALAARLATGRERVYVCRGAMEAAGHRRLGAPSFPFDDLPALERLMEVHGQETAGLMLAPCGHRSPSAGYLKGVRALCDRIGAVLIFDETLSGFRVHEGGAQAIYGVRADLMVFGESVANGMPLGVLAGRRELVEASQAVEPLRADLASLAAAKAVLTKLRIDPVIGALRTGGAEVQAEVEARLTQAGLDGVVTLAGDPASSRLEFRAAGGFDPQDLKSLWMNECLAHHLFTLGAVNMSYAHGERDIAVLLAAFDHAADRLTVALDKGLPRQTIERS